MIMHGYVECMVAENNTDELKIQCMSSANNAWLAGKHYPNHAECYFSIATRRN